ncbi:hypothetical protein AVEN_31794-1 [Araneus ventricosus]|uniref:Uncharacterized protein n=1 Tax=Araneus ventricosus TaxID=182803 RepID=A0A4Y2VFH3_ARAVE|nr:hypothetical protein AVEN_170448-1 [Araneus ventricosus]GBO24049.1 hypothetical protein AVEN_31794-1 [Araneus ventricosus]
MLAERLSPRWSSTGLTPFLGKPGQCGYFYATPTGGRLATTYDLACNRPHTRRIFSGNGFRTLSPPATLTLNEGRGSDLSLSAAVCQSLFDFPSQQILIYATLEARLQSTQGIVLFDSLFQGPSEARL